MVHKFMLQPTNEGQEINYCEQVEMTHTELYAKCVRWVNALFILFPHGNFAVKISAPRDTEWYIDTKNDVVNLYDDSWNIVTTPDFLRGIGELDENEYPAEQWEQMIARAGKLLSNDEADIQLQLELIINAKQAYGDDIMVSNVECVTLCEYMENSTITINQFLDLIS